MAAGPKIMLYVDVVSPFAYLAYYMLRVSVYYLFIFGGQSLLG